MPTLHLLLFHIKFFVFVFSVEMREGFPPLSAKEWYSENNIIKLMISQIKYQILGVKLCLKNFFNSSQPFDLLKSVSKFPTSWLF